MNRTRISQLIVLLVVFGLVSAAYPAANAVYGQEPSGDLWEPPIGIPEPPFGVHETVENCYGDPHHYTYWVDNSVSCDSSNTATGSPAFPRCTIPTTLVAGDVVQIAGGTYAGKELLFKASGTPSHPIFVRGTDPANKPKINYETVSVNAEYLIIENLAFPKTRLRNLDSPSAHFSLRHSQIRGPVLWNAIILNGSNIVVYGNHIHDVGYNLDGTAAIGDRHGITMRGGSKHIWILDNEIERTTGDGIQFCHGCAENLAPQLVYIGRNTIHDCLENAVDLKTSRDVVISQNTFYGFRPVSMVIGGKRVGSDGTSVIIGANGLDDPAMNVWVIFNRIFDSQQGIRVESAASATGVKGPAHLIGNVIYNIVERGIDLEKDGDVYLLSNTIHDADVAVNQSGRENFTVRILNNIFSDMRRATAGKGNSVNIQSPTVAARSVMSNNLVSQTSGPATVRWGYSTYTNFSYFPGGTGNLLGDASFVNTAGPDTIPGNRDDDFHLRSESDAIGKADGSLYDYSTEFCRTFGAYIPDCASAIDVDMDRVSRPNGAIWDIGAFEFEPGRP